MTQVMGDLFITRPLAGCKPRRCWIEHSLACFKFRFLNRPQTAFNQLMDDRSSYSEELSTEAYFRAVSSTLASNLYTRIKKLNMIEKDWLQHLESQMSDCHNIAIREDRLKKAALIKSTNDEVNKFIDGSLIKANFTISTIDEQYNEFKKKLH